LQISTCLKGQTARRAVGSDPEGWGFQWKARADAVPVPEKPPRFSILRAVEGL